MFNKLQFNNLVITNKKKIQQGRVQTINKLVQKIRKLKSILEKRNDSDEKSKQRLRKWTHTMEELKKLKRVDIMKKLLLLDKAPQSVVTNGRAPPEEFAVAMLAMNGILKGLLVHFREQLNLDEAAKSSDDSWKETLMESSKRQNKRERTEEKKQKRSALKEQKAIEKKRIEWIKDNRPSEAATEHVENDSIDANISKTGAWKVEAINDDDDVATEEPVKPKVINETAKIVAKPKDVKPKTAKRKLEKVETQVSNKVKLEKPALKNNSLEAPRTDVKVQTFANAFETKPQQHPKESKAYAKTKPKQLEEVELVEDPFFITETGENYLSTAVARPDDDDDEEENEEPFGHNVFKKKPMPVVTNPFGDTSLNRRERRKMMLHGGTAEEPSQKNDEHLQNLHPSWAAKQKLKPIISKFEGKKIKFSEEGNGEEVFNGLATNKFPSNIPPKPEADNSGLHPSWIAKQKLKPAIATFQGKKITFDNDDD